MAPALLQLKTSSAFDMWYVCIRRKTQLNHHQTIPPPCSNDAILIHRVHVAKFIFVFDGGEIIFVNTSLTHTGVLLMRAPRHEIRGGCEGKVGNQQPAAQRAKRRCAPEIHNTHLERTQCPVLCIRVTLPVRQFGGHSAHCVGMHTECTPGSIYCCTLCRENLMILDYVECRYVAVSLVPTSRHHCAYFNAYNSRYFSRDWE